MRLVQNYGTIIRKAWSSRLMLLAMGLTGLEAILQFLDLSFLPNWFALLILAGTTGAAWCARLVAQESLHTVETTKPVPEPQ